MTLLDTCCTACRAGAARIKALGLPEELVGLFADPLMGVDLTDRRWVERFDAEHPNRKNAVAEANGSVER